jgi:hypothetical protein
VKLVMVKSALIKLSDSHLKLVAQSSVIFEGTRELASEIPEPPPPGDPVSCIRYTGYANTKGVVERVKSQVNIGNLSFSVTPNSSRSRLSSRLSGRPLSTSTPLTSPNSSIWSHQEPPEGILHEPPPPYNMEYLR